MIHQPTEDISGDIDPFAMADDQDDPANTDEEQTVETVLIQEIRKYLKEEIAKSNTLDVMDLPKNATNAEKIAAFNEAAIHKGLVFHLRNVQNIINNKVKEN